MFPLVSIMLFLPLVGATLLVLMRGSPPRLAHAVGIVASGLTLLGSLLIWARGVAGEGFSQLEEVAWIPSLNAAYRVGVDGISLPLVLMTAVLFFVSLLFSAHITEWARSYVALFLLLETASIGVFVALRRTRRGPFLRLLRGHARRHVLRHLRLELRGTPAGRPHLLPLHPPGLEVDGPGPRARHFRREP